MRKDIHIRLGADVPTLPVSLKCNKCGFTSLVIMEDWGRQFQCDKCKSTLSIDKMVVPECAILLKRSRNAYKRGDARTALIELVSSFEIFLRDTIWACLRNMRIDEDIIKYILFDKKPTLKDYTALLNILFNKSDLRTDKKNLLLKKTGLGHKGRIDFYGRIVGLTDLRNNTVHNVYIPTLEEIEKYYKKIDELEIAITFVHLSVYGKDNMLKIANELKKILNSIDKDKFLK